MAFKLQEAHDHDAPSGGGSSKNSLDTQDGSLSRLEKLIQMQKSSDESIHSILAELGTPYASVGILSNNRITARVIGSLETNNRVLNEDTLFQAASISKPLTAMAVIKLCQEGKLDLDVSISKYLNQEQLSWISTPKTLPLVKTITLRHLLTHTSGLSCTGFLGYPTSSSLPSLGQILQGHESANNEKITLSFLPGQGFQYSGGGFTVVQYILEMHLKKPFHQLMDEIILVPLGMTRSTFDQLSAQEENYAPAYTNGTVKASSEYHFFAESAAAGLWTTPTDLLKAIQTMQKSLKADDFLERRWAREMLTEVGPETGIGWRARKGEMHFGHAGSNDPGYFCYVGGYADISSKGAEVDELQRSVNVPEECGLCVMTSSTLGLRVTEKLIAAIAYLEEWPWIPELQCVPFVDREKLVNDESKEWCGKWGPGDWRLRFNEDGILVVRFGDLPGMALIPGAVSSHVYDGGKSIDLVVDGLEIMLRLGWKEKARIIEVWQEGGVSMLESVSNS